jgi:YcaO-like protein with predicted kinase domain
MTAVSSFDRRPSGPEPVAGGDGGYSDRARTPAETCRQVAPFLSRLGITRVAKQTGLDRIGIPVFSALRPNARTLSSSQGKGISEDAARASATMEAVEFAYAEKPALNVRALTPDEAQATGIPVFDALKFKPIGSAFPSDVRHKYVTGSRISGGGPVLVPYDLVDIDETDAEIADIARSSNGLASGNTREEATLHGLLELIERDATTLARLDPRSRGFGRRVAPDALADPVVDQLIEMIRRAGFDFWLFDQTSDIGVPVLQAVIGDPSRGYWRHFDLATGYGCHPNPARAAIRAITEAAQTRVTNIAGARDDFRPTEYRLEAHSALVAALEGQNGGGVSPSGMPLGVPTSALLRGTLRALQNAGTDDPIVVDLGGEDMGIAVVRVFSPDLEDRSTNRNWRPGPRAARLMLTL